MSKDLLRKVLQQAQTPVWLGDVRDGLIVPVSFDGTIPSAVDVVADYFINVAQGNIEGTTSVNKFGRSTNVDSSVDTDIWDRANATDDQDIWVAPVQARVHNIASDNAADDGSPVGNGARTIRVFGLPDWNSAEVSEDIVLDGVANVATVNSYVIIHRMRVLTSGTSGPNVGTITATAVTDGTVTAQINPSEGQTQMAIYGIPSTQTAYMTQFYASILRANLGATVSFADLRLLFNPQPDDNTNTYLVKHSIGVGSNGNNPFYHPYQPYNRFSGPGVLKLQASGSANNLDISAGFDLILVDN